MKIKKLVLRGVLIILMIFGIFLIFIYSNDSNNIQEIKKNKSDSYQCLFYDASIDSWIIDDFPPDSVINVVKENIAVALRLNKEKSLSYGNLFECLKLLKESAEKLKKYKLKLPIYYEIISKIREGENELCELYKKYRKQAEISAKLGKFGGAYDYALVIITLIPDNDDPRCIWAKKFKLSMSKKKGDISVKNN